MNGRKIEIGINLAQFYSDIDRYREAWIEADELGADRIFVVDHFFALVVPDDVYHSGAPPLADYSGKVFEATSLQAAMAATTKRAKIGCMVHGNSYRNPNLLADIARTIDHISGGRYILGVGAGHFEPDYVEYGYEFGTPKSRALELKRDVPIIRGALGKAQSPSHGECTNPYRFHG